MQKQHGVYEVASCVRCNAIAENITSHDMLMANRVVGTRVWPKTSHCFSFRFNFCAAQVFIDGWLVVSVSNVRQSAAARLLTAANISANHLHILFAAESLHSSNSFTQINPPNSNLAIYRRNVALPFPYK